MEKSIWIERVKSGVFTQRQGGKEQPVYNTTREG